MKELDIYISPAQYVESKKKLPAKPKDKFLKNKLPLMDKYALHRKTLKRVLNSNIKRKQTLPKGLKKMSTFLLDFYSANDWEAGLEKGTITANWENIVGKILSKKTKPKFSEDGKKLTIVCLSPVLVTEVEHYTNVIYDNINKYTNNLPEIFVSGPQSL